MIILNKIKELQNDGFYVFHNTSGHPIFFRNNIPHISYSTTLKLSKKYSRINNIQINEILVNDFYYLNDNFELFHLMKGDYITITPLENLK